jgi:hypothetical protein
MCNEWKDSFQTFHDWAIINGYAEDLSIDRTDNDKGYSPSNCRWATRKEQANNTRRTIRVKLNGGLMLLSEVALLHNINYNVLYARLKKGMPIQEAISKKIAKKKKALKEGMDFLRVDF